MPYDQYGNWYDSTSPWLDTINNAIWAGAQTAQVAEAGGYPPPQYPATQYPATYPPPQYPATQYPTAAMRPPVSTTPSQPGFSFSGSPWLWVIGGLVLVIALSGKKH